MADKLVRPRAGPATEGSRDSDVGISEADAPLEEPVIAGSASTVFGDYLAEAEHRDIEPVRPVNLAAVLAGGIVHPEASILYREDGVGIFYPASVHAIVGPAESGKSWLALRAAAELLADGRTVVMVDYETSPAMVVQRLVALGVAPDLLVTGLVYLTPDRGYSDAEWRMLHASVSATETALVVVDSVSECFAVHGLDTNSTTDAASFSRRLRPFAVAGAAVLQIDHVSKGGEGRTALGSQHKRAGVDVEVWVEAVDTPHPKKPWRIRIGLSKDRHGGLYEHAAGDDRVIASATVISDDVGTIIEIGTPGASATVGASSKGWRPEHLMQRVAALVKSAGGDAVPVEYLLEEVRSKDPKWIHTAIEELVADGTIVMDHGDIRWPETISSSREEAPDVY